MPVVDDLHADVARLHAICSAPLLWPSSPGLPTRILSGRPSLLGQSRGPGARTFSCSLPTSPATARGDHARRRPVLAEDVSQASAHSPVVTPAWAARIDGGITLPPFAFNHVAQVRPAPPRPRPCCGLRNASSRSICSRSADSSTFRMLCSPGRQRRRLGLGVNLFTPTTCLARIRWPAAAACVRLDQAGCFM